MTGFYARYQALIANGELRPDADQDACAQRLSQLQEELEAVPPRGSVLWRMFSKKPKAPRGIYMWGGVGRGKSMLMDLFYDSLQINRKKRAHFHEFMLLVHDMMRAWREADPGDPIPNVVRDLAQDARFLAFDEMVVNNSADAMIMSRLFTGLVEEGGNPLLRPPIDRLLICTRDGLNREHFLPFIDLLENRLDVISLNGPTDYRARAVGRCRPVACAQWRCGDQGAERGFFSG